MDLVAKVLIRKWFETAFAPVKLADMEKEDLVSIMMDMEKLDDQIKTLKNPRSQMTSSKLIRLYLKSYRFTTLQKRLLKYLSDCKPKTYPELRKHIYRLKNKTAKKSAFDKLLRATKKGIELSGSSDVFKIVKEGTWYQLLIDDKNLTAILLNKKVQNFPKSNPV